MATGAGGIEWFPHVLFVAARAGYVHVIGVQAKARHGVMFEEEILSFPSDAAVAFLAVDPQGSFVRLGFPVAAGARGIERSSAIDRANDGPVVTAAALGDEVSSNEVEGGVTAVIKHGLLGSPSLRGVAGRAGRSIPRGVFHGMAAGALGGQCRELSGAQRPMLFRWRVALDTFYAAVFAHELKGGVAVVDELRGGYLPTGRCRVAGRAVLFELAAVGALVAIRAGRL